MRKYLLTSLIVFLINSFFVAQTTLQTVEFGDMPKPVPSVSSLSTYTEKPSNSSASIPEVSIPLLKLSSTSLVLNYNPLNVTREEAASEVGLGWTLFKGGIISRKINGKVDEIFQSVSNTNYQKNEFDDIYYYNLPGISGKFIIKRDIISNTFQIVNLSPINNIKIEYTRQQNDATLIIDSFTITDDEGNKYYFNDFTKNALYGNYYVELGIDGLEYKSAFFLSQIKDANNIEVANFSYHQESKYFENQFLYQTCKLKKIISPDLGSMEINYVYDSAIEKTMNDPYSIQNILLKNSNGDTVNEIKFEYTSASVLRYNGVYDNKRILNKITKRNSQLEIESTSFVYHPNDSSSTSNILKKIIYPNKSATEYIYEDGEIYLNKDSNYINNIMDGWDIRDPKLQFFQKSTLSLYDTEQSLVENFIVPGDITKKKYFKLSLYPKYKILPGEIDPETGYPTMPPPLSNATRLKFTIKRGSEIIASNISEGEIKLYNYPGQYSLEITVTYYEATGSVQMSELSLYPPPYINSSVDKNKFRIKSVNQYNYFSDSLPTKSINYTYDDFALANSSSGYYFDGLILYKNIKITEGSGNGYTKIYYKIPSDYPSYPYTYNNQNVNFWPYYDITKAGLLEKTEIYNNTNQILKIDEYSYALENLGNNDYKIFNDKYSKPSWIKSYVHTSKIFPIAGQSFILTKNEILNNSTNYNIASSKQTSAEGMVTEVFYKYAADKNNQKLISQYMYGVLLETETKINNKTVSKTENKYENTTNLFPSSVVSTNPNDSSTKTAIKYDSYDIKGNLVQYTTDYDATTGKGNSVTTIWGYNKTLPIAKIEGAKLSDIGTLADDIVTKSNADIDTATENILLTALDTFRNETSLKDYLITTYTYDPLIGVTTVTSPSGMRQIHKYDANNRLKSVTDANGNIIKEMKYNNKQ